MVSVEASSDLGQKCCNVSRITIGAAIEQDESPPARDSQILCLVCPAWSNLREGLDVTDVRCLDDMVMYFQRVIKAREEKADREKKRRKKEREEEESQTRKEGKGVKRKRGQ